ncbi:MAG: B12-binding domain-containing radical SAM protein [Desulfurococcales archaeon]|nr:B12-binding domain-containing radical SAM protein [Desulfurococcales archaeon]
MRILLTLPPEVHNLEIYKILGMKAPPLGLASIAAALEHAGHKVRIIDSPTLELGMKEWLSIVRSEKPDLVGISVLTPLAPKAYEAVKVLKAELPDIPVVMGGPHPTFMFNEALDNGADIIVLGEGELTTLELVETLEREGFNTSKLKDIPGIAFRDDQGRTVVTKPRKPIMDLDSLPWPARHLLPMEKYTLFGKPIRVAHVMASRGCPYGCIYCTTSYFWGRRVRFRSASNVASEVEHLVEKYNVKYLVFSDDELLINRRFVREFIKEMKDRGIDLPFACGARVDHVDRKILKLLSENNCVTLYLGVESASQETLNRIGKRITIEQVERAFQLRKEFGIPVVGSFILGFPWETIDDMKRTVDFAIKLDPDYAQFTALTPYPGTPLYEYAKKHKLIEDWNWEHYTTIRPVMRGFNFTREELARMIKYAYRRFYLRFSFIKREIAKGRIVDIIRVIGREVVRSVKDVVVQPIQWMTRK